MKNKIHLLLAAVLLVSCGSKSNTTPQASQESHYKGHKYVRNVTGVKGGKLVFTLPGNIESFNPLTSNDNNTTLAIYDYIFQGLTTYNPVSLENEPQLAELKISEDGLSYVYTLRDGILWADGAPLTLDDVLFTFGLIYDENLMVYGRDSLLQSDGTLPQINALSHNQIEFKLSSINVLFESAVGSIKILPKHIWAERSQNGKFSEVLLLSEDQSLVFGTGPFMLDSYVSDQRMVYKRNPHYFEYDKNGVQLPYLDRVIRVIVPDFQAEAIKFKNREIDYLEVRQPEDYDLLKRDEATSNFKVHAMGPGFNTTYLVFNQNNRSNKEGKPYVEAKKLKLFSDKRFKQAVSYAIDRESIANTIMNGHASPLYTFTSNGNKIWHNPQSKKYAFDLEKAKALLNEIGLKDTNGDTILEYEDGSPLEFSIKTNSENSMRIKTANLIKNDLLKLGISVNLLPIPMNSVSDNLNTNYDFDAVILGWASGVPADPVMSKNVILSSGKSHNWNPQQPTPQTPWEAEIDRLMLENQSTLNLDKRKEAWYKILDIWSEELPEIMLFVPHLNLAVSNYIGNAKPVTLRPFLEHNIAELYDKRLEK